MLSVLFACIPMYAQQYAFGITGYGTGYMGDINPNNPFYYRNAGAGLVATYNLNPTWGLNLGFNYLKIQGQDIDANASAQQVRNLQFNNNLTELSLSTSFNFFRFIPGRAINRYTPYITVGIAAALHNPFLRIDDEKVLLRDQQLEFDSFSNPDKYSRVAISIPVGVGFKYNIRGPWSVGAELNYRTTFHDNLDNVSKNYATSPPSSYTVTAGQWEYLADPSGALVSNAGKARGNGQPNDGYMTAGLNLTYTIISTKCYWWK